MICSPRSTLYFLLSSSIFFRAHQLAFTFEKSLVYQKTVDVADPISPHTDQFSRNDGFLIDQLARASISIAAKIAEAMGGIPRPTEAFF
ncbi:MAG: four helix bundle protein [Rhizobium sp.]|nr:MAG: four helix bundle protein [Rhizobium sp.]